MHQSNDKWTIIQSNESYFSLLISHSVRQKSNLEICAVIWGERVPFLHTYLSIYRFELVTDRLAFQFRRSRSLHSAYSCVQSRINVSLFLKIYIYLEWILNLTLFKCLMQQVFKNKWITGQIYEPLVVCASSSNARMP